MPFPFPVSLYSNWRTGLIEAECPYLIAEEGRKARLSALGHDELVSAQKPAHQVPGAQTVVFRAFRQKVVAGDADGLGALESLSHAENGEALGTFNVHLQKVDGSEIQLAANGVDGGRRDGEPCGGVEAVGKILRAIFDENLGAAWLGDRDVKRDYIPEAVIADQLFEAAKGAGVGLDANNLAAFADGARKGESFFTNTRSEVEDDVAGFGHITPEEVMAGSEVELQEIEAKVRLVISEVPVGCLVDPDSVFDEDPLYTMAAKAGEWAHEGQRNRLEGEPVEESLERIGDGHKRKRWPAARHLAQNWRG